MKKLLFITFITLTYINIFAQDTLTYSRNYIPWTDTTLVFTPRAYQVSHSKYPLVILLHGWSGNYKQWNNIINVQKYADHYNFIIVTPDGFYDSWYVNSVIRKKWQFQKFFWGDLIPDIFKKYRIDTKNIFISGLSMGGHGAMILFLKHPDFFKSAGSTSGILDITMFSNHWGINKVLGPIKNFPFIWKNNSAIYLLKNIVGKHKKIIFDCGKEDFVYKVNKKFYDKCKSLGIDAKFISTHGNHSHKYWHKSIKAHFDFFKKLVLQK